MSTGHVSSIDKIQSGNEHLDRVQDQLRAKLNPVLTSTILNAKKYRWNEMAYPLPSSPICWLLQTFSSGAWTTVVAFDQSGKVIPSAWIAPTLTGGFANLGGGFQKAGYYQDVTGRIYGRGILTNAAGCAAGTTVYTLPLGYRPVGDENFAVIYQGGFATVAVSRAGPVVINTAIAAGQFLAVPFNFDTRP